MNDNSFREPGLPVRPSQDVLDRASRPGAAAMFAAVTDAGDRPTGSVDIMLEFVNATPAKMMLLADRLLARAAETIDEQPDSTARRTCGCRIRAARSALGATAETARGRG